MNRYSIGVDIGGTNTDVVLIDDSGRIVASKKEITSLPLELSACKAIVELLQAHHVAPSHVDAIFFGTTHATNAILEVKELLSVGLIRIAGQRPDASPSFFWPDALKRAVLQASETIDGGYECHGAPITPFDKAQAKEAIVKLLEKKVSSLAVVGVFSPLNPDQECQVGELITEIAGKEFPFTLSHKIGGMGFLERENATLLNSSLKKVIGDGFSTLVASMKRLEIHAPLYMVQNDGSIMDLAKAMDMPILTISAGQTNSFIGACKVAKMDSAIVVDVGGTSTDIGTVVNGVPKRSCHATDIGGVELHFPMPDALSIALGGGSVIHNGHIGPESVARRLKTESQCFGGNTLTLTDVGIVLGLMEIPGASKERVKLSKSDAEAKLLECQKKLEYCLQIAMGKEKDMPILLVGGGAPLAQGALKGTRWEQLARIPEHAAVANAYGSALAEVAATTTIVAALGTGRQALLDKLKAKTIEEAVLNGASRVKTRIANVDIIPYAYSKDGLAKISVTALGPRE